MNENKKSVDMPTRGEIAKERAQITKKIENLKNQEEKAREEWRALPLNEKTRLKIEAPDVLQKMRVFDEIAKKRARLEKIRYILSANYRARLAVDSVPLFLEILKKYDGKKAGDKTRAKIADEMRAACGVSVWFDRQAWALTSRAVGFVEISAAGFSTGEKFTLYANGDPAFIDDENTIHATNADGVTICGAGEYIQDAARRVAEIEKAREKAEKARAVYNNAVDNYRALIVDGFDSMEKAY